MRFALMLAVALLTLPALAGPDESRRAGQIQLEAKEAYDGEDVDKALKLAQRAIALDDGAVTWLAQQLRIEILEGRGDYEQAMTHLQDYLKLDKLFPEHRAWGDEARQRIGGKLAAASQLQKARKGRMGAGVGLLVGGAVPLGLGIGWLANYGANGSDPDTHGGYLDAGLVTLGIGIGLDVAGAVLLASSAGKPKPAAAPAIVLQPRAGGLHVGVGWRL